MKSPTLSGERHACALLGNGTVRCWGNNASGQLGDATTTQRATSVPVSGLAGAVSITAGRYHTCARLADVKREWDPDEMIRANHAVSVATA